MKQQIKLVKYTSVKNASGDWVETVAKNIGTWAEVQRLTGSRAYLNGQVGLDNLFQFKLYFNPSFDPTGRWRVIWDRREFSVHSIEKENAREFYWIIKAQSTGPR